MAIPLKLDQPEKRERFLGCLRAGMRRGKAARTTGISRKTAADYAKAHPDFAREVEQAEVDACELVEEALLQTALKGNTTAIIFYLTNRSPERWRDRRVPAQVLQVNTHTNNDLAQVQSDLLARIQEMDTIKR